MHVWFFGGGTVVVLVFFWKLCLIFLLGQCDLAGIFFPLGLDLKIGERYSNTTFRKKEESG